MSTDGALAKCMKSGVLAAHPVWRWRCPLAQFWFQRIARGIRQTSSPGRIRSYNTSIFSLHVRALIREFSVIMCRLTIFDFGIQVVQFWSANGVRTLSHTGSSFNDLSRLITVRSCYRCLPAGRHLRGNIEPRDNNSISY